MSNLCDESYIKHIGDHPQLQKSCLMHLLWSWIQGNFSASTYISSSAKREMESTTTHRKLETIGEIFSKAQESYLLSFHCKKNLVEVGFASSSWREARQYHQQLVQFILHFYPLSILISTCCLNIMQLLFYSLIYHAFHHLLSSPLLFHP